MGAMPKAQTSVETEQKLATPTKISLVVMVTCGVITAAAFALVLLAKTVQR